MISDDEIKRDIRSFPVNDFNFFYFHRTPFEIIHNNDNMIDSATAQNGRITKIYLTDKYQNMSSIDMNIGLTIRLD